MSDTGSPLPPPSFGPPPGPFAGPPPAPFTGPAAGPPGVHRNTGVLVASVLLAVIALVGIGFAVFGGSGGGSTATPGDGTSVDDGRSPADLGPGEVWLEPLGFSTRDPFTDDEVLGTETQPTVSLPDIGLPTTTAPVEGASGSQVSGAQPGLYGGTRNNRSCDKSAMITFLESHLDKAAAWAGVQGIDVADIGDYIRGLTPVLLTHDTRVTNHGFENGAAYAHPSVLQAGTAVLVDEYGIPRAKCSCGNPLTPPEALSVPPTYVGDPWPTFDPPTIVVVIQTVVVTGGFVLVDVDTGEMIVRPVGADADTPDLATGDVRVTLQWNDSADLDLQVTDPAGDMVNFDTPTSASGGQLDVDANRACESVMSPAVENIVWPATGPSGEYTVVVSLYDDCGSAGPHSFSLHAFVGGIEVPLQVAVDGGTVSDSDGNESVSIDAPYAVFFFSRG